MRPKDAMPIRRKLSLALAAVLPSVIGCGSSAEPETRMAVQIPFAVPLGSCPQRADIGLTMQAVLEIGGHEPCPLTVDKATLAVSGDCDRITVGIVRPLGLSYWLPNPSTSDPAALAYIISWVDLRKEHLGDATTEVAVNMTPDVPIVATSVAELLSTNNDVQSLRDDAACTAITEDKPLQLCKAEAWAKGQFQTKQPINFDIDAPADNVANIVEACNGTLFP
jgi:hypothetical protein